MIAGMGTYAMAMAAAGRDDIGTALAGGKGGARGWSAELPGWGGRVWGEGGGPGCTVVAFPEPQTEPIMLALEIK